MSFDPVRERSQKSSANQKLDSYLSRFVHKDKEIQAEIRKLARQVMTISGNRKPDGLTPFEPMRSPERQHRLRLHELTKDDVWIAGMSNNPRRPEPYGLPGLPDQLID